MLTLSPPFVSGGGSSGGASLAAEPFVVASTPTNLTNSTLVSTVIQLGVYGSIPLASSVPAGSLYFASDTFVIWRSTGAAWVSAYSLDREVFEDLVSALIADNSDLDWTYTDNGTGAGSLVAVIKAGAVTNAMLAGSIAYSKLALTGAILNADLAGSIAYNKLALTGAILNADLAGSIAYAKLALTGALLNADINAAAAIAYSKLNLTGGIVNADISASAAIALSKIAAIALDDLSDAATAGEATGDILAYHSGTGWTPVAAPTAGLRAAFSGIVSSTNFSTLAASSNGPMNWLNTSSGAQNATIRFNQFMRAGTFTLDTYHRQNTDGGIYTVAIDGSSLGTTIDGYAASAATTKSSITSITVATTGNHTVDFTMATKNASSSSYFGRLYCFEFFRTGA